MIRSWRLMNFKSVRDDTTVELAPLTVLAGANSSGKSTLLQSMLMIAQTIQSPLAQRPVVLNGPLVRLGSLRDVTSHGSSAPILVGFEVDEVVREQDRTETRFSVRCNVSFAAEAGSEVSSLRPWVTSVDLAVTRGEAGSATGTVIRARRARQTARERARELDVGDIHDEGIASLAFEVDVAEVPQAVGCSLSHFLPTEVVVRAIVDELPDLEDRSLPGVVYTGEQLLSDAFSALRYLGPLRDEPRWFYPLSMVEGSTDVGLRGEYTAAVFDLHRSDPVRCVPAAKFSVPAPHAGPVSTEMQTHTLGAAVVEWLQYLGVVDSLTTRDLGNLGHELKVTTGGAAQPQDLTHVGTGVSQVLPIVVMCLLAAPDTTVLIEQPEVHLHPAVQARLADFFLAMALSGRQVIVETHSEYLVNRLRYRIAAATDERLVPLVKLYFVEKEGGASKFTPVRVNKYGSIGRWPVGFFDQGKREIEQILRAGVGKKQAEIDREGGGGKPGG